MYKWAYFVFPSIYSLLILRALALRSNISISIPNDTLILNKQKEN